MERRGHGMVIDRCMRHSLMLMSVLACLCITVLTRLWMVQSRQRQRETRVRSTASLDASLPGDTIDSSVQQAYTHTQHIQVTLLPRSFVSPASSSLRSCSIGSTRLVHTLALCSPVTYTPTPTHTTYSIHINS